MSYTTKQVFLYNSRKNLPKEGWLQPCCMCNEITGNTMNIVRIYLSREDVQLEYITYICLKCENKVIGRLHYVDHTIHRIKHKFFKTMDNSIRNYLNLHNIYNYSIENVENTTYTHSMLTEYLRKYTYFPVEPKPPAPLAVASSSSTNSTRENGDKSGVQI